ncbi:MAG TPA: Gfo/Idh/MocA family oxidoreductase, partial [Candidatus Limnocylindria bacterium]|nr:Gfo/Idh/MocA family oxidoreductase [Candidatus Limnocylindria bacterium]
NANILVEYENGANGAYWCTQVAAGTLNGLAVRVYGDEGSLEWRQEDPDFVRHTPRGEAPRILTRGNGYVKEKAGAFSRLPTGHPEGLHVAFANIYREFVRAVAAAKAGEPADGFDFPRAEEGVQGVRFIHAAVASAAQDSRWVELPS